MAAGLSPGDLKEQERDGNKEKAFFLICPDGLCYYFHQPL